MKVDAVSSKEVKTRFGMKKTYSMKCDDGHWYSLGFKDLGVTKDDEVEFDFENTPYGNQVKPETLTIISKGAPSAGASAPAARPAASGRFDRGGYQRQEKVFPIPLLHGDRSIVRQNSISNAVKCVTDLPHEIFFGDHSPDAAAVAKAVIELAKQFEMYSAGDFERLATEDKSEKHVEVEAAVTKAVAARKAA